MSLEHIKPGDEVIERSNYAQTLRVVKVDRVTKTQIICGKTRYRKAGGGMVGGSGRYGRYGAPSISEATPERRKQAKRHGDLKEAKDIVWRMSRENPERLLSALEHLRAAWAAIEGGGK